MLVSNLKLYNYRNFNYKEINLSDGLNIIIGDNGTGKTNILESLIVLSNTKSFRTLEDYNLIKKDKEYSKIEAISNNKYKVVINDINKRLYINDVLIKKTSEFIGKINCILFKPSDLNLFNNSPKERRRILDIEIGKVSSKYLKSILNYNLYLKDKNKLLKEERIDNDYLDILDTKMIEEMKVIIKERENFFNTINKYINDYFKKISNLNNDIKIEYLKCSEIDDLEINMNKSKEKDLIYHYSTFGTHHDDFKFYIDDNPLESIASQGQSRMALISFKLSIYEYIKEKINDSPIILLDDIVSELDTNNASRLFNILPNSQIVITCTDINNLKINKNYNLIKIGEEENAWYKNKSW